ncbi:hypothetical protein TanjilG_04577 [Lupinus angustifolius]|uniref:Homeobox domain-containing protein n=1 Tax=Lupinus angustifolius TaxID=3871 RepID=A0A4P1RQ69_LUPAN|nr:hypothetical protein TanjilG_04577 [Lupinus angustifolius]
MWMMGYDEDGEFNMVDPSFHERKLRTLMPRPMTNYPNNTSTTATITPCLNLIHGNDLFSQYHHLATMADHSRRDQFNFVPPVVVSSRWNPTPEQLRELEELYRRGTRTPSAEQIQHITAQLRRFAASRTVFEVEQTKNWVPSTHCTSTLGEESVSIQMAEKAENAVCKTYGWLQFNERELQQRRNFMEKNDTCHVMQFSCPSPAPATNLINTPPYCNNNNNASNTTVTTRTMDPTNHIKTHNDLSFFISPQRENGVIHLSSYSNNSIEYDDHNCVESNQTLQLFPLRNGDGSCSHNINDKVTEISASAMNANLAPSQFFEFLPLKN